MNCDIHAANLRTKPLDFGGFDSSGILNLRCGILMLATGMEWNGMEILLGSGPPSGWQEPQQNSIKHRVPGSNTQRRAQTCLLRCDEEWGGGEKHIFIISNDFGTQVPDYLLFATISER